MHEWLMREASGHRPVMENLVSAEEEEEAARGSLPVLRKDSREVRGAPKALRDRILAIRNL